VVWNQRHAESRAQLSSAVDHIQEVAHTGGAARSPGLGQVSPEAGTKGVTFGNDEFERKPVAQVVYKTPARCKVANQKAAPAPDYDPPLSPGFLVVVQGKLLL
jgi:hypothetical protein